MHVLVAAPEQNNNISLENAFNIWSIAGFVTASSFWLQ